eukprot:12796395-Alexandrium_andersonii.AAC.1
MSASLVGSEMCIRDSFKRIPPTARSTPRQSSRPCATGTPSAARVAPISVSYTHLTLPTICSV